jgi:hypothetical protein
MSMPQRAGKKWPLVLILNGLAISGLTIAIVIAFLAYYLYILSMIIIYFSIILIFSVIFIGRPRDIINSLKFYTTYFLPLFMILTALGFTLSLSDLLYTFLLHMSSVKEFLQFYPMLFAGAITSTSIMFAVTYWVVNRAENIAELTRIIQFIKMFAVITYVVALLSIFISLSNIYSHFTSSTLYGTSILLSYPFGLTAGMIITSIILDILTDTLRRELRRQ